MPVDIQCQNCQRRATVPDSARGKSVRCSCGNPIAILPAMPDIPNMDDQYHLIAPGMKEPAGNATVSGAPSLQLSAGQISDSQRRPAIKTKTVLWVAMALLMVIAAARIIPEVMRSYKADVVVADAEKRRAENDEADKRREAAAKRQAAVLDDMVHEFKRTEAGKFLNRDNIRVIVYVIHEKVPERRQAEAWTDLLTVANFASYAWLYIRDPDRDAKYQSDAPLMSKGWMKKDLSGIRWGIGDEDFNRLPEGAKTTFQQFVEDYYSMAKECWGRGTTVEAEARKALGE